MKLQFVTIGSPKLHYAQLGWDEYLRRLGKFHKVSVRHLSDKYADDSTRILQASQGTWRVAMAIDGDVLSSQQLATKLTQWEIAGKTVTILIGGPAGLPQAIIEAADFRWSLSSLTFPHDMAMLVTAEALYRASTIEAGVPYHK